MGVLGKNAGVLGGIGQAMSNIGMQKREERLAAIANEREIAIRQMEQDFRAGEAGKQREFEGKENNRTHQREVAGMRQREDQSKAELASRESEGAKERASREKIAGIAANSRIGAAGARGSKTKRFTINKVANEDIKKGTKTEDIVVTDNDKAVTYKQQGDIFVPQGATPRIHKGRAAAEARLREQPGTVDDFVSQFGYLPAWFMKSQEQESSDSYTEEEE